MRVAQIIEARDWLFTRLSQRDVLRKRVEAIPVAAIDEKDKAGDGLRAAAEAGDIMALRAALRAARERQPSASSFIDQLEKLAAGYQLERIRQLLRDHPPP